MRKNRQKSSIATLISNSGIIFNVRIYGDDQFADEATKRCKPRIRKMDAYVDSYLV